VAALVAPFLASGAFAQDLSTAHDAHAADLSSTFVQQVRQATEIYQDIRQAGPDYAQFLGCFSGPQEGAMGIHLVNGTFAGDAVLDVNRPEALIYEVKNGAARLVGVEYLVDAAAWHAANPLPPVLGGQSLHFVDSPNRFGLPPFYELHVWAWRENPNGTFVDWNPHVSCDKQ
jgi:hypothetical protein